MEGQGWGESTFSIYYILNKLLPKQEQNKTKQKVEPCVLFSLMFTELHRGLLTALELVGKTSHFI